MPNLFRTVLLGTSLALAATSAAWAVDPVKRHSSNAVWFENWSGLSNATLIVVTPDGARTEIQAPSGTPVYKLDPTKAVDGVYDFELRAATKKTVKVDNTINQGRGDAERSSTAVPYVVNGTFTVERGMIVIPEEIKEEGS